MINSSRDFKEYSLGKSIAIKENETQQLELHLKAGVSMQDYDAHVHFDFKCFSENIKPTITQTSDKCIKLQLCNVSQNTIEMPAEQNIILLARKDIDKSSPLSWNTVLRQNLNNCTNNQNEKKRFHINIEIWCSGIKKMHLLYHVLNITAT